MYPRGGRQNREGTDSLVKSAPLVAVPVNRSETLTTTGPVGRCPFQAHGHGHVGFSSQIGWAARSRRIGTMGVPAQTQPGLQTSFTVPVAIIADRAVGSADLACAHRCAGITHYRRARVRVSVAERQPGHGIVHRRIVA